MDTSLINTTRTYKKRVGRGGKRGKTAGKGTKGQKSRAGKSIRPAFRDVFASMPRLRGHNKNRGRTVNSSRSKIATINVSDLEKRFKEGAKINPSVILKHKLVSQYRGRKPIVKILGMGDLKKSFHINNCIVSKTAEEKITKVGGKVYKIK